MCEQPPGKILDVLTNLGGIEDAITKFGGNSRCAIKLVGGVLHVVLFHLNDFWIV